MGPDFSFRPITCQGISQATEIQLLLEDLRGEDNSGIFERGIEMKKCAFRPFQLSKHNKSNKKRSTFPHSHAEYHLLNIIKHLTYLAHTYTKWTLEGWVNSPSKTVNFFFFFLKGNSTKNLSHGVFILLTDKTLDSHGTKIWSGSLERRCIQFLNDQAMAPKPFTTLDSDH